jgi:restriction system protein
MVEGPMTELRYRLHWARSYLKAFGAINNFERGVWTLTPTGEKITSADVPKIKKAVREKRHERKIVKPTSGDDEPEDQTVWTERLLEALKATSAPGFERLCQRVLRESGFVKVEVTGKSGNGGIDGLGVLRVNLVSFHVLFQAKRWKTSVGTGVVRDFRGAMVGRADKGLIITTASFTADARKEATRDGAPAIDLVDCEGLCALLKSLKLFQLLRPHPHVERLRNLSLLPGFPPIPRHLLNPARPHKSRRQSVNVEKVPTSSPTSRIRSWKSGFYDFSGFVSR